VMADVDRFKAVNDLHGHHVGDDVLKVAGQRFGAQLRSYDALGRYGGEEFLAVLPGCDAATAARVAERMRSALSDVPVKAGGHSIAVTASFGVALADKGTALELDAVIAAADEALYRAKRDGRNRVAIAEQPSPPTPPGDRPAAA
jgi:diguanylate cyclase (GGDEF)-like protein